MFIHSSSIIMYHNKSFFLLWDSFMDSAHRPSSPNVSFTINSNLNLIPSLIQVIFCSTYIRKFECILFHFPAYLHENYKLHYVQQTMPINNMVNHFLLLTFSCFFFFFCGQFWMFSQQFPNLLRGRWRGWKEGNGVQIELNNKTTCGINYIANCLFLVLRYNLLVL